MAGDKGSRLSTISESRAKPVSEEISAGKCRPSWPPDVRRSRYAACVSLITEWA